MSYKILIFDLDDTLINNRENVRTAFKRMITAGGGKYSGDAFDRWYEIDKRFWRDLQDGKIELPDKFRRETGKKSDEFLDWVRSQRVLIFFNNSISPERAIELNDLYMNSLTETVIPIDGAYETLKYLNEKYIIIVATNGPQVATRQKLEKIKVLDLVNDVLSADMFGYMKPKVEFFDAIEKRYRDYERKDYLIIGDSLKSDVGFGQAAKIDSCWLNSESEVTPNDYKPTYIIKNLTELKDIL